MFRTGRLGQAGFTLTEALVATVVGLLAIGAMTSFNIAQMYGMRDQSNQVDLQSSARAIADLFAREVRTAGLGTNTACSGTVSTGILLATANAVRIRADRNGDGNLTGANDDVTYVLNGDDKKVTRTDNGLARTDILWAGAGLSGSSIRYFDVNGTELAPGGTGLSATQLTQVARVKLQLALTGSTARPGDTRTQTARAAADVELRNRYYLNASCWYR